MISAQHLAEPSLVEYAYQELSIVNRARADIHLSGCPSCRARLERTAIAAAAIEDYLLAESAKRFLMNPPQWPDFEARLQSFELARSRRSRWRWPRITLGAIVVGGLALAWYQVAPRIFGDTGPHKKAPTRQVVQTAKTAASNPGQETAVPARIASRALPNLAEPPAAAAAPRSLEVAVVAALHRIGADIGDPIEIGHEDRGTITVTASGLPAEREAEVRAAILSIPGTQFHDGKVDQSAAVASASHARSMNERTALESKIEALCGGKAILQNLANDVLDEDEMLMIRAHAIHNLDRRFPAERLKSLTGADRELVAEIRRDHMDEFRASARKISALLAPFRRPQKGVSGNDLYETSQRLDRVLNIVFGGSPSTLSPDQLLTELAAATAQLALVEQL